MNGEYTAAIEAEREAWHAMQLAGITAVKLQIEAINVDPGPAQDAERWIARMAEVREGICRERWNQSSEALAEAAANRSARSSAMRPTA